MLLSTVPQPAQAYTQNTFVTLAKGIGYCIQATAGIDHRQPGIFSANQGWGAVYALTGDCKTGQVMQARIRIEVQIWDPNHKIWRIRAKYPEKDYVYVFGMTGSDAWGPTGPQVRVDYGELGYGYHRTKVDAQVYHFDARTGGYIWSGGILYSDNEWMG
ncbi:hypothetical protein ACQP25_37980 [Microtetraspora malaysiensis]|uniref:hypothetical protein n=1 Tax=Microtetraspora malaysiensis TaxID=161358 RepID=UPI003D90DA6A